MNDLKSIEDVISSKLKQFQALHQNKEPQYVVLGRDAYFMLKEAVGIPAYDEMATYQGFMIHILPAGGSSVNFLQG